MDPRSDGWVILILAVITEGDTCQQYVLPKLREAGGRPIAEQKTFTDGRIIVVSDVPRRAKAKRADYLKETSSLTYTNIENSTSRSDT
jgi:hypothetical protein